MSDDIFYIFVCYYNYYIIDKFLSQPQMLQYKKELNELEEEVEVQIVC